LSEETGKPVKLPSYKQARTEVQRLKMEPELVAVREGAIESLFRWMTQRFERRLPNTSYGVHDAQTFDVYYDRRDVGVLYILTLLANGLESKSSKT